MNILNTFICIEMGCLFNIKLPCYGFIQSSKYRLAASACRSQDSEAWWHIPEVQTYLAEMHQSEALLANWEQFTG